jgi:hypothetical protein
MMQDIERLIARYRQWYRKLLRFYSKPYRERFAESMEQTFNDLCRERIQAGKGIFGFILWVFVETSAGIIRENGRFIMMQNKNILRIALVTACILLVPLLAGWPWDLADFVIAGALLFGTGLTYELVARRGGSTAYRAAVGVACAAALLLVWMNGAVGIIGNENQPANLMYFGVLAIGFFGALIARFRPHRMARALFATAVAQALVPGIALVIWPQVSWGGAGMWGVFVLNGIFVALWVVSALLFRHAEDPWSKSRGDVGRRSATPGVAE